MLCSLDKMENEYYPVRKIKIEDIIFFIFIAIIIGTALWLLSGSPPEINAIITIGLAVAGSELLIWRFIFKVNKGTSPGFMKVKHDMEKMKIEIKNGFNNINNKLNNIQKELK